MIRSASAYPFGKERIRESVVTVEFVKNVQVNESEDGLADASGVGDVHGPQEITRKNLLASVLGDTPEDAHLDGREFVDGGDVGLGFARENEVERHRQVGLGRRGVFGRRGPQRIAKLLHVAGNAVGDVENRFDELRRDDALAGLEASDEETGEVLVVNPADVKERGGLVEGASRVREHLAHLVSHATEKDVGRFGSNIALVL